MGKHWLLGMGLGVLSWVAACGDDTADGSAAPAGAGGLADVAGAGVAGSGGKAASGTGGASSGVGGTGGVGGAVGVGGAGGAAAGSGGATSDDDSGTDDPCDDMPNACDEEGIRCDGDTLVTCALSAGCLLETRSDCATGADGRCDGDASPPRCAGDPCVDGSGVLKPNACTEVGTSCAGDTLIDCEEDADGCPIANRTDCTLENDANACRVDGNDAECVDDECVGVSNCDEEGVTCRGTRLVTCVRRQSDGCLVEQITNCAATAGRTCDPDRDPPRCATCSDECDEAGTSCDGDVFETCEDTDEDTCLELVREPCGDSCNAVNGCVFDDDCDGPEAAPSPFADTLREEQSYGPFDTMNAGNDFAAFGCAPGAEDATDLLFALDVPPDTRATVTLAGASFTGTAPTVFLLTDCSDVGPDAEQSCVADNPSAVTYFNSGNATVRVYIVVDASGAANTGTFGLELDTDTVECGDGVVDEGEACDDGNNTIGDGCNASCQVSNDYACTSTSPSVCTERNPEDGICGNLRCALPENATEGSVLCCTVQGTCGLAYPPVYGENCIELAQAGVNDNGCEDEASTTNGYPTLNGCCRPDGYCGLSSSLGLGCVRRNAVWAAMADGDGPFYSGPFNDDECD